MRKSGELYQYKVTQKKPSKWAYEIYCQFDENKLIDKAKEYFDSAAQAGFAAVGHIILLEYGDEKSGYF